MATEGRYYVTRQGAYWQVIDTQYVELRVPRIYETYTTETSARECAARLNGNHAEAVR